LNDKAYIIVYINVMLAEVIPLGSISFKLESGEFT